MFLGSEAGSRSGPASFQADPGDGCRVRGDRERASWFDDRASLFMTARAYLPRSPATLRESQPIRSPSRGTSEKTSPCAQAVGRLSRDVAGLRGKEARTLIPPPRFLAKSRDLAANKPASSSSLGTLKKTSPCACEVSLFSREVPGHWEKQARELIESADFLAKSRDFGKKRAHALSRSARFLTQSRDFGKKKLTRSRSRLAGSRSRETS